MSVVLPTELAGFGSYYKTYVEFKDKDKLIAYACLLYTVTKAMEKQPFSPEIKTFLMSNLDQLEKWKKELKVSEYNEVVSNDTILSSHISNIASKIFQYAEIEDTKENYTPNIIKAYFLSRILFNVSQHFDEDMSETDVLKKRFATQRSLYLRKCLDKGIEPANIEKFTEVLEGGVSKLGNNDIGFNEDNDDEKKNFFNNIDMSNEVVSDKLLQNNSLKNLNKNLIDFEANDGAFQTSVGISPETVSLFHRNKTQSSDNAKNFYNKTENVSKMNLDSSNTSQSSYDHHMNYKNLPQNTLQASKIEQNAAIQSRTDSQDRSNYQNFGNYFETNNFLNKNIDKKYTPPTTATRNSLLENAQETDFDSGLDYTVLEDTQKLIKHFNSALSFNDIDTSIEILQKIIYKLRPYAKNS